MKLKEAEKRVKLKWSVQASIILAALDDDFPIEEFEKWVEEKLFVVGGGYITEFLELKSKSNGPLQ